MERTYILRLCGEFYTFDDCPWSDRLEDRTFVKRAAHRAEYLGLLGTGAVLRMLPDFMVRGAVNILARMAFDVLRIRRRVTLENLGLAFGESTGTQRLTALAREAYANIGMTFVEMLLIGGRRDRIPELVDMTEAGAIRDRLETGKGVIIVSCHFGSWELNGASLAVFGIPVTAVAKRQSNPLVDRFIERTRTQFGMKVTNPGASIRHMVAALRRGEAVGLISDQDAGRSGVYVDFFGKKASTPAGAAQLALKYGSPVFVSMTRRTEDGRYASIVREVEIRDDDTVEVLTARFTKIMEEIIARYPEQYFWMHRRWKTRPPDENARSDEGFDTGNGA